MRWKKLALLMYNFGKELFLGLCLNSGKLDVCFHQETLPWCSPALCGSSWQLPALDMYERSPAWEICQICRISVQLGQVIIKKLLNIFYCYSLCCHLILSLEHFQLPILRKSKLSAVSRIIFSFNNGLLLAVADFFFLSTMFRKSIGY